MTIPRRDLLTGAALVLVGSASGCGASAGKQELLRTQFMADFTAKFIGDPTKIKPPGTTDPWPDPENSSDPPTRLWPQQGQLRDAIATDYATFVNVLMSLAYVGGPPPSFPPGSLGERILQFLQAQNWPTGTPVPPGYETKRGSVNLVEIAVILDRLLQAINSFKLAGQAPGGGGSGWPPH